MTPVGSILLTLDSPEAYELNPEAIFRTKALAAHFQEKEAMTGPIRILGLGFRYQSDLPWVFGYYCWTRPWRISIP